MDKKTISETKIYFTLKGIEKYFARHGEDLKSMGQELIKVGLYPLNWDFSRKQINDINTLIKRLEYIKTSISDSVTVIKSLEEESPVCK